MLPRNHAEFSGRFGSSQFAGLNASRIDWGKCDGFENCLE
jgi:hypothetical protein